MEDLRYIYSVARVRVLENRLLRKDILYNMAAAHTLEDTVKLLEQTGSYPIDIVNIKNSHQLEEFANTELLKLDNLARELFVDEFLYKAFKVFKDDLVASYLLVETSGYSFLREFFRRAIDLANIRNFLRLRYRQEQEEVLKNQLICGGYLQKEFFLKLTQKNLNDFRDSLLKSRYADFVNLVTFADLDFAVLERETDNYLINFIKPAKYLSFNPEAIFGYLLAKGNEIRTIRFIIMSKLNSIEVGSIRKRMVETYA